VSGVPDLVFLAILLAAIGLILPGFGLVRRMHEPVRPRAGWLFTPRHAAPMAMATDREGIFMKMRLVLGAALLAIVAGGVSVQVSAAGKAAKPAAKPVLGTFGVDTVGMDKAVAPGNDFYKFVNGGWEAATPIPSDRASWGGFAILRDLSDQRTRAIIETVSGQQNAPGSPGQKVGDYFASFMDEAAIEAKGIDPIKPMLVHIGAIQTQTQLAEAFGIANRLGVATPIGMSVEQDLKDNSVYSAYLGQSGLGLPDRDYYLEENPRFVEIRAKYVAHIGNMLKLAGVADSAAKAQRIFDLEKKIAATHWTQAQSRQIDKLYNPVATGDLAAKMPGFDWTAYLKAVGVGAQPQVIATQPSALTAAARIISSEPLDVWKDYLTFHLIKDAAPFLSKAFVEEDFAFNGPVLSGTPALKERWKRGVDSVNAAMGEAVGQIYVAKYFPPASKAKADELVRNLRVAFNARIDRLEWMAPETKVKAREKLTAFTQKIGYPDKWRDYSALKIVRGDAVGNALRATEFEYNRQLAKIGKPVDRGEWGMTPQTVNAYANPLMNEVVFPAAILQAPFFDPKADDAVNYGGIGSVIGHELSHHFDDQGRKFDPRGNLTEWWTAEDVKRFDAYTAKVVQQYGAYEPLAGKKVNGELTLGENMADLAGVTIALDAYRLSLKGKPAATIGGYTGDQRFFLGFAQVWRTKYRDANLLQRLTNDPHTPGHYRAYVVRNLDAWYAAFGAKPGEKYYLTPAERVKVW
jgi:putative endopeptidase